MVPLLGIDKDMKNCTEKEIVFYYFLFIGWIY
jgi:hypothetical protein